MRKTRLACALLAITTFAACLAGPHQLNRTVDDWDAKTYVDSPWLDGVLWFIPVFPLAHLGAQIGDFLVVDAYAFPPITPTPGPLINSGGHGNWKKIGPRTFAVTVKYFQLNPQLNSTFQILDSLGTVRETVVLSKDGQSYTSVFQTVVELSGGGIIPNAGATTATRINVEPLP